MPSWKQRYPVDKENRHATKRSKADSLERQWKGVTDFIYSELLERDPEFFSIGNGNYVTNCGLVSISLQSFCLYNRIYNKIK